MKNKWVQVVLSLIMMFFLLNSISSAGVMTHEITLFSGEELNLKTYFRNNQLPLEWTNATTVQNMNASILSLKDSSIIKAEDMGTGMLIVSNGLDSFKLKVVVKTPVEDVVLEKSYLSLLLGEIYDISYTVRLKEGAVFNEDIEIIWYSSKPKVAKVLKNNQIVTMAVGDVTITGKLVDGTTVAEFNLTVFGHSNNVTIKSDTSLSKFKAGETLQLKAYFGSKNITKTVEWQSLTPNVIKVDQEGMVTAIGEGKGLVKAQSSVKHKSGTYELNVSSMIDYVELNKTHLKFKGIGQTQQLVFSVYPKDKSYPPILSGYKYVTSNEAVATVTPNGLVTAKNSGIALISVIFDDSGKKATCTVEVLSDSLLGDIDYIPIRNISVMPYKDTALIGQKIPLRYKIIPENATNQEVHFTLPYGDNKQIQCIDNQYYFVPSKRGNIKINLETADGLKDQIEIVVTSPIESLALSLKSHRITGTNQELIYIGEKSEIFTRTYTRKGYDKADVYPSSLIYKVGDERIAKVFVEDGRYYIQGLKQGKTKLSVKNLEGIHEASLWIEVEDPILSISTDRQVTLPISYTYKPRLLVDFIKSSKVSQHLFSSSGFRKMKVNQVFLSEEFINNEIIYEKNQIQRYDKMTYDLSVSEALNDHKDRLNVLMSYKNSIVNGYTLLDDLLVLKDRKGRLYQFYKIDGDKITSNYPIKLDVEIFIKGSDHRTSTLVVWQNNPSLFAIEGYGDTYDANRLIQLYGLNSSMRNISEAERVKLLVTYINYSEFIVDTPTYELLRALEKIERDGYYSDYIEKLNTKVTKGDLVNISMALHSKYVDRDYNLSNLDVAYYYDVVDSAMQSAISLNYVEAKNEYYFGVGDFVTYNMYNTMIDKVLPTHSVGVLGHDFMTFEDLIIELSKFIL